MIHSRPAVLAGLLILAWPRAAPAAAATAEERAAFDRINAARRARDLPALRWDDISYAALKALGPSRNTLPPTKVYSRVAERRGYAASASFHHWEGPDARAQAEASPHVAGSHTHGSLVLEGAQAGLYLCRIPLPDSPTAVRGAVGVVLYRCPACGREWPRRADDGAPLRASCAHCDLLAGGYLDDSSGVSHWATHYTRPWAPTTVTNPFLAWQWTNERIRYDHHKLRHKLPGWQTPKETASRQTGVCRDTAVFLAAWLRQMKVDARVVTGFHDGEGHAWVVMFEGDTGYLLETAMDGTMSRRHPPRLELATQYLAAELMFDDRRVWISRSGKRTQDYRSAANWAETKEEP